MPNKDDQLRFQFKKDEPKEYDQDELLSEINEFMENFEENLEKIPPKKRRNIKYEKLPPQEQKYRLRHIKNILDKLSNDSSSLLKLANNFEEKLRKMVRPKSGHIAMLLRHNIIPVIKGLQDEDLAGFLGTGISTQAYEVIYKNKLVVAKVSRVPQELQKSIMLSDIKKNLPHELGRHIMSTYEYIEDNSIGILIVEKLLPLSSNVAHLLSFPSGQTRPAPAQKVSQLDYFKRNKDFAISYMLPRMNDGIKHIGNLLDINLSDDVIQYITEIVYHQLRIADENLWKRYHTTDEIRYHIVRFLEKTYNLEEISDSVKDYIERIIHRSTMNLLDMFQDALLPTGYDPDTEYLQYVEELSSLQKLLMVLAKDYGIEWADLASRNLMERPGTKDIVICDPGFFKRQEAEMQKQEQE